MKLPIILGALLLSSTPAFADDFVYLKCSGTNLWRRIELSGKKVEVPEETTLHLKIDAKKKLYVDSLNPEFGHKVKILNGVIFEQFDGYGEDANGTMNAQIAFDPLGKIISKTKVRDNSTTNVYSNEFIGNCEASNASEYEASK